MKEALATTDTRPLRDADATALPTSEVVVAAYGGDAMYGVLAIAPGGDTNHVLCRGQDEPLSDFGRRVEWRVRALGRKSALRKVCYLLGPQAANDWFSRRQTLVTLIGLLSSGAEFELVTAPSASVDVLQTLGELMPHAPVGVRISIRQERSELTTNLLADTRFDADGTAISEAPSHPGPASVGRRAAHARAARASLQPAAVC